VDYLGSDPKWPDRYPACPGRDLVQRIENAGKKGELQDWRPTLSAPNIPRPTDGIPQDIAEHMRFFLEQVGSLARKPDSIHEGPRKLLDNTMLLFRSSMLTVNHEADRLPAVILGGAGGRIKGGRVLNYEGKPERQMCRLYLSMMDKMNVRLPKFGDATKASSVRYWVLRASSSRLVSLMFRRITSPGA
jgi:hypothetical protein